MFKETVEACIKAPMDATKPLKFQASVAKELSTAHFLGYYATGSGNFLPTFRYNLSIPSSVFKNTKEKERAPKDSFGFLNPEEWGR